jgi:hypothetical protein
MADTAPAPNVRNERVDRPDLEELDHVVEELRQRDVSASTPFVLSDTDHYERVPSISTFTASSGTSRRASLCANSDGTSGPAKPS